jgi:hypothetical protein
LSQVSIYPNPNRGQFNLKVDNFGNGSTNRQLMIYDAKGARVHSKLYANVVSNQIIEVKVIASRGIYLVVLTDETGKIKLNEKVLIQ